MNCCSPSSSPSGSRAAVLVERLRAIDLSRLDEHVGRLTPDEQRAVDQSSELVLGF
jgi:mRNA-degrading endonuclease toxin of MazEF toxin-antitoxin module